MTGFYSGLTAFYSSIAFLTLPKPMSDEQREILESNIACIKEWSIRATNTWLHKNVLLEVEMKIANGAQQLEILDGYDHAIALANRSGFVHDAAFINERCGTWIHDISKKRSIPYLENAYRCYMTWVFSFLSLSC